MARKVSVDRANEKVGGFATAKKNISIQFRGQDITQAALLEAVRKNLADRGIADADIDKVDLYIKPEEHTAYYVINDEINGQVGF